MIAKRDVLIINDDTEFHKTITQCLIKSNYEVISVVNGRLAKDKAREHKPSVALIDDMQDPDVLRQIKKVSPTTECILITGHASLNSAIEAVNLGAFSFIQKPFDLNLLLVTVLRANEKHASEEKLRFLSQIIEQVDESVVAVDLDHKITWVNHSFQSLFGYSPEEIVGKNPGLLNAEPN